MLLDKIKNYQLYLGSQSPRRKLLLEGAGIPFITLPPAELEETYPLSLTGKEIALFLAEKKAEAYNDYLSHDKTIIITADTIVWINQKVLGKPENRSEAIQMLSELSGNEHMVYTGVCIKMRDKSKSFYSETAVKFRNLSHEEIEYYVDHYQPYDKAGSYGAQEWIGYIAIQEIHGSYFNVMGLPIQMLFTELEKML
ncbi:MAG: Maf-like protein [Bacteroidales bacterium]